MTIKILPDTLASQIAAGEVVERPSSVVKELIENSIDAEAAQISIEIQQAGRKLISVSDDGVGIEKEDLELAVCRHATSKLADADDLFDIKTLGFRGEALASMASVSRLILISKEKSTKTGSSIIVDGGNVLKKVPVAAANGTVVRVEDLFFNVPARLKFLKTDTTENRQITGLVTRYALAYPQIRWNLVQDSKTIFQTTGSGERFEILQALFGSQDAKQLMPISFEDKNISIDGYISNLSLNRSNRRDITLFVNGRWVQDAALTAAVIRAYNTMLMVGRYPVVILFLKIPTNLVDVNVHPSKAEVRFREGDRVFSSVQRAIRRGLLVHTPVPGLNAEQLWGRQIDDRPHNYQQMGWAQSQNSNLEGRENQDFAAADEQKIQPRLPGEGLPLLRLIGQVASTYLIAEGPDGLYLIDQHAAHERVLFDQMMAQFRSSIIPSQTLLEPQVVELSAEKAGVLENHLQIMKDLGFEIEFFGPNSFIIRSVPSIVSKADPKEAINAIVNAFEEDETPLKAELEAQVAARVCKRVAVKGGQVLTEEEQRNLLLNLEASQSPRTCPHGRPTMIHLSAALLERQFGRTGAI